MRWGDRRKAAVTIPSDISLFYISLSMRAYRYTLSLPLSLSVFITGDRNKGWYYGENVRTGKRGWFPLAYTEQVKDVDVDSG